MKLNLHSSSIILIINSLKSEKTKSFIELYCGNNALNTKELAEIVPIYIN